MLDDKHWPVINSADALLAHLFSGGTVRPMQGAGAAVSGLGPASSLPAPLLLLVPIAIHGYHSFTAFIAESNGDVQVFQQGGNSESSIKQNSYHVSLPCRFQP